MTESQAPSVGTPGALSREQLRSHIVDRERPLVAHTLDLNAQIQPNGIDLTLQSISRHLGAGTIGADNKDRMLPDLQEIEFDENGWISLQPGIYHLVFNEIVDIPSNLMALGRPRSSLGRSGVTIHTAVWDAGYRGRSTSLLSVLNPAGFRVQKNARVMQLVFFGLAEETVSGYDGAYQDENMLGR
jgi:dUTP pyrophosphatase